MRRLRTFVQDVQDPQRERRQALYTHADTGRIYDVSAVEMLVSAGAVLAVAVCIPRRPGQRVVSDSFSSNSRVRARQTSTVLAALCHMSAM